MSRKKFLVGGLALALALALAGCDRPVDLSAKVFDTEARVSALEMKNRSVDQRIALLESGTSDTVWLTPTDKAFQFVAADAGPFAVSIESSKPMGNGTQAVIRFANLTSATVTRLKFKVSWGPVDAKGSPVAGEQHQADRTLERDFKPGAWNAVPIALEGVPPSRLGLVIVGSLQAERMSLYL